ncbi:MULTISPECIES: SusD/RagB family nutrient-binding outer membrane lipoprotein [unclassified Saccharicrinis]|uniref:SusD/RagB family nutrient-binding outer membrane lipoprotein n=1 Tax=unclassified Saccharicrinis TaxID=2646859 RepID=UPI003D330C6D
MKNIIIGLSVLLLSACFVGCTDDFEAIDTKDGVVNSGEPAWLFVQMLQTPRQNYQRNTNLYDDFYAQYWSNIVSGFESPRYEYVNGWIGNQWIEFYTQELVDANFIKSNFGDDPAFANAVNISEIWMVHEWARMAATYGDIPYFDAGNGVQVPYNTEEEIYDDLFDRLDVAIAALDAGDASQYSYGSSDLFFNGDVEKWKRFGNSLRLRLGMRLANVAPAKAEEEVKKGIAGGVMQSNDDVARIPFQKDTWFDYLDKMAWDWNNIRASKTFTNYLYNQSTVNEDPRAWRWFTYKESSPLFGSSKIVGVENGYDVLPDDASDFATINMTGTFIDFAKDLGNDPIVYMPIMYYTEVLFLQAEAALRGWGSGDPDDLMRQGIQASMDYVGVDAADAQAYIDGVSALDGSNEEKLKKIITHKWISNFPNGIEAWADFRRTDYPDITLPIDGVSGSASVASGTWVKRIRYPDNAHEFDSELMPSSKNTIESDRMDIRLWWDVADTKDKTSGLMNSNF